jgi:hypothetical protein
MFEFDDATNDMLREVDRQGVKTDLFLQQQRAAREQPAIVRKTFNPDEPRMSAAQQAPWDDWVRAHIERAIEEHDDALIDAIAGHVLEVVREQVGELSRTLDEKLGQLRAELTLQGAISRGEIAQLKTKTDAA